MYIKNKNALNIMVREIREALALNKTPIKFNTAHQVFARSCSYKTQAALLSDLPTNASLNEEQALIEENLINQNTDTKSNLHQLLKDKFSEETGEYNYLLARIDLLMANKDDSDDNFYIGDEHLNNWKEILQNAVGESYNIVGGIGCEIHFMLDDQFCVFDDMEELFNKSVEENAVDIDKSIEGKNPFNNYDEDNGWIPNVSVLSYLIILKIDTVKINCEITKSFNESQLNSIKHLRHNESDANNSHSYLEIIGGDLSFSLLENVNIESSYDEEDSNTEDVENYNYFTNSEVLENHFFGEMPFDSTYESLLFIDSEYDDRCTNQTHMWALKLIKSRYDKKLKMPNIDLLTAKNVLGEINFDEDDLKVAIPHYDLFGAGSPDLASGIQHTLMRDFGRVFDSVNYYCIPEFDYYDIYDKENCVPAVLNHFGEGYRNWPDDVSKSTDKQLFAFEIHGEELINKHNIKTVTVDDFQESYGGMTGVLLVTFYNNANKLIAELSYCIFHQVEHDRDNPCIELTLDKKIRAFCSANNIDLLWTEHNSGHPYGQRMYNQNDETEGLLPATPHDYQVNSTQLMGIRFGRHNVVNTLILNQLASEFFIYSVSSNDGKDREQFRFDTIINKSGQFSNDGDFKEQVIETRNNNITDMYRGSVFLGGYYLKGMDPHERHTSIHNSLISYVNTKKAKDKFWFQFNELMANEWCSKLNIPEQKIELSFFHDPFEIDRVMWEED